MEKLYLVKIIIAIIIAFAILSSIEYSIYKLFLLTGIYWYFSVIIVILINIIIIRIITLFWVYEFQFPTQQINIFIESKRNVKELKFSLIKFKYSITCLLDTSSFFIKSDLSNIKQGIQRIKKELEIYEEMQRRYGNISKKQYEFYRALNILNNDMQKSGFSKYFEDLDERYTIMPLKKIKCEWKIIKSEIIDTEDKIFYLRQIRLSLNFVISLVEDYYCEDCNFFSWKYILAMLTNDALASKEKIHVEFLNLYKEFHIEEGNLHKNCNEGTLNYSIISTMQNQASSRKDKHIVIFCGPNGGPYEFCNYNKLLLFLKNNIDVMLWNYRGYGLSTGKTTFNRAKEDVLLIYDLIQSKGKYSSIGTLGYSIGGIAASYLARMRKIDLIISDRSLGTTEQTAYGFHFGVIIWFLYQILLIFSGRPLNDFLNAKGYKIIICSAVDTIITNYSCIKSSVSRYIVSNFIREKKNDNKKYTSFLDMLINSNEKEEFINCITDLAYYNIQTQKKLKENEPYSMEDDKNQNSLFLLDNSESSFDDNMEDEDKRISNFFKVLKENSTEDIDFFAEKRMSKRRAKMHIECFFNNFFIWGTLDASKSQNENEKKTPLFSPLNSKKILQKALEYLVKHKQLISFEVTKDITVPMKKLGSILRKIIDKLDNLVVIDNELLDTKDKKIGLKLIKEKQIDDECNNTKENIENGREQYNNFENKIKRIVDHEGHLVRIDCGHNGSYTENEVKTILHYLEESKFLQIVPQIIIP